MNTIYLVPSNSLLRHLDKYSEPTTQLPPFHATSVSRKLKFPAYSLP